MTSIRIWLLVFCVMPQAWAGWPDIAFPDHARIESLGDQLRLNGVPMRMYRVTVDQSAENVANFYREALGPKHAETKLLGDQLLSQGLGTHFITVRVHALGRDQSACLISISDNNAASHAPASSGIRMPIGTAVLSDMESVDAGRGSRHLVGQNRLSLATNLQALEKELASRGFKPEDRQYEVANTSTVRLYRGYQREARLVLTRRDGTTFIELTTLNDL